MLLTLGFSLDFFFLFSIWLISLLFSFVDWHISASYHADKEHACNGNGYILEAGLSWRARSKDAARSLRYRETDMSLETNERQDSYTIFVPVASVPTVSKASLNAGVNSRLAIQESGIQWPDGGTSRTHFVFLPSSSFRYSANRPSNTNRPSVRRAPHVAVSLSVFFSLPD